MAHAPAVSRLLRKAGFTEVTVVKSVDGSVSVSSTRDGDPVTVTQELSAALGPSYHVQPDPKLRRAVLVSDK